MLSSFQKDESGIYVYEKEGYWSNLEKEENQKLLSEAKRCSTLSAVRKVCPDYEDVIFSPKRWGSLGLLELNGKETCTDLGCMWGALTIPLARQCKHVIGVDQTYESLAFLQKRADEENLKNIDLLCGRLNKLENFGKKSDVILVNGVLEWIPDSNDISLKKFIGKRKKAVSANDPEKEQEKFLRKCFLNLNERGKLLLAIENRFDLEHFFGKPDPHVFLNHITYMPRWYANIRSNQKLGRNYVNYLYSFKQIEKKLKCSGFSSVRLYACWPDYRFADRIMPIDSDEIKELDPLKGVSQSELIIRFLTKGNRLNTLQSLLRKFIFRISRAYWFAPSIIAIAQK
jgi:hypothetical protein